MGCQSLLDCFAFGVLQYLPITLHCSQKERERKRGREREREGERERWRERERGDTHNNMASHLYCFFLDCFAFGVLRYLPVTLHCNQNGEKMETPPMTRQGIALVTAAPSNDRELGLSAVVCNYVLYILYL